MWLALTISDEACFTGHLPGNFCHGVTYGSTGDSPALSGKFIKYLP